ncbi:MAG TPA: glycosyltransferase [Patescibacteria group bacterium]|nr:glycosyltransferase [Patescibacteria group bacterium]
MKVAIVHDYLIDFGGAERVLLALHEIYPDAPVYVSIYRPDKLGKFKEDFKNIKIIQSWFGNLPFADILISPLRFCLPIIWKEFDLSDYDLIIDSSAWAITRGFKTKDNQIEICYCHTPPRYIYGFDTSRSWKNKWYGPLIKIYAGFVNEFLRNYDSKMSQKVDYFIANSKNVANRIQDFYHKDSVVIYPPVELQSENPVKTSRLATKSEGASFYDSNERYFLAGGRLVAAKNFDLIIKACMKANVKLKIFGTGILDNELKSLANKNMSKARATSLVEFLGKVDDKNLYDLYAGASGFIVAQKDEDFGITAIESQITGTPVIAYRGGGYLESVIENKTGIFFDELTIDSLSKAISKFEKIKWNKKTIQDNAKKFSKEKFKQKIRSFIKKVT